IREEVRKEFEERQRILESSGIGRSMQDFSLQEVESRLRSEIEIQVRRDFLNQLAISGGDLAQAQQTMREPEKPSSGYDVKHSVSSSIPLPMSPTPPARPPVPAAPPPRAAAPAPAMDFG